jgi:hypothetical protein
VVLASDSSHYYENIQKNRPFVAVVNIADTLDSFRKVERLADSPRHVIPGHDPLVMTRYPAASSSLKPDNPVNRLARKTYLSSDCGRGFPP